MSISIHLENTVRQTHILTMQVKLFLFLQLLQEEDLLGNQTKNSKHHSEEGKLKKVCSLILTSTVCARSYLSITSEPRIQSIMINNAFKHKNGATRYSHIKVGRNKSCFTNDPLNGDNKYTVK